MGWPRSPTRVRPSRNGSNARRAVRLPAPAVRPGLGEQPPHRVRLHHNVVGDPPATNIEEQRRQAVRQNDREVRKTIVRVHARHLQDTADMSWSGNDFDFTGVLFEDASFVGATFNGRRVAFDGAVFIGVNTSFDDVEFNAETVTFQRRGSNPTPRSPTRVQGPLRLVRRGDVQRERQRVRRGQIRRQVRYFDERLRRRPDDVRVGDASGACGRRSTRRESGTTSTSTGTTPRREAAGRSRGASPRDRGRPTCEEPAGPGPRPDKDDGREG